MDAEPTLRSTLPTGRLQSGTHPGQQLDYVQLGTWAHVFERHRRSLRCRSTVWPLEWGPASAARLHRRELGARGDRLRGVQQPGLEPGRAAVAVAAQVRLVLRPEGQVAGLRYDDRRRVDTAADHDEALRRPRHDAVVRGERRDRHEL